jgi:hypothetical protein
VTILALVAGVGCLSIWLDDSAAPSEFHHVGADASASGEGGAGGIPNAAPRVTPARRVGPSDAEPPTRVRLPSGRVLRVVPVSAASDGVLDIPDDVAVAGWWRGGARLGDPFGSTLVAAHVDSTTQGLGPFVELLSVRPGARVVVRSASLRQVFRVRSLRLVPRISLDQHPGVSSARGLRRLTLVTCAGPYDRDRGGYQNLAVVVALPMSTPMKWSRRP